MKKKHLYLIFAVIGFVGPYFYVVALLTVGLSFALPLFLYVRESHLEAKVGPTGGSY
jgi:hypothetical protein